MPTCSFCKKNYAGHKGLTLFTFDGRNIHFCSSKCRRNANLKRDPRKVNWVKKEKKSERKTREKILEDKKEKDKKGISEKEKKLEKK